MSRVLFGWAEQGLGGTVGQQYLAATGDLMDEVQAQRFEVCRDHLDLYLNQRPSDLPSPLVVEGFDGVSGRWCVFRKQPAENAPNRHLVEFLLAPEGVMLTPSDALVWLDRHDWIKRTDGPPELETVHLPVGAVPPFDGLEARLWPISFALFLELLNSNTARFSLELNAFEAAQVFRFVFGALPATLTEGVTFSTFDSRRSELRVVASPFASSIPNRRQLDSSTQAPDAAGAIAAKLRLWSDLICNGAADENNLETLRYDMERLRSTPVMSIAELTSYFAVLDGTASHLEVAVLLESPMAPNIIDSLGRDEATLHLVIEAATDVVARATSVDRVDVLLGELLSAASDGAEESGRPFVNRYLEVVSERSRVVQAMGGSGGPQRNRQLVFLARLCFGVDRGEGFADYIHSTFGNGIGAPPEIRGMVIEHVLRGRSAVEAALSTANVAGTAQLGDEWWVVPVDDLRDLLDPSRVHLSAESRIEVLWRTFVQEQPTFEDWQRHIRPVLDSEEIRWFVGWMCGDEGESLAGWLVRDLGDADAPSGSVAGVADWLLESTDVDPPVALAVATNQLLAGTALGSEIASRTVQLLKCLVRGSWLEAAVGAEPEGRRSIWNRW